MEIYKEGRYWFFKNTHGPVPKVLRGAWTNPLKATEALDLFQSGIRAKTINVTERTRQKRERATRNSTTTAGSE